MNAAIKLQKNWDEVKAKLREKWKQLNSDDLHRFDGDIEMLVELIERKTGESRESIEQFVSEAGGKGYSVLSKAKDAAVDYVKRGIEGVQQSAAVLTDGASRRLHDTTARLKRSPVRSSAVCLGAGVICGVALGLAMSRR